MPDCNGETEGSHPGAPYGFRQRYPAQALGDLEAIEGRRLACASLRIFGPEERGRTCGCCISGEASIAGSGRARPQKAETRPEEMIAVVLQFVYPWSMKAAGLAMSVSALCRKHLSRGFATSLWGS